MGKQTDLLNPVPMATSKQAEEYIDPETGLSLAQLGSRLTIKQRRYMLAKLGGATNEEAGIQAGYRGEVATRSQREVLGSASARAYWRAVLAHAGLDDATIARRLSDAALAMRTELSRSGDVVEMGPDHRSRLQAVELAMKISGQLGSGPGGIGPSAGHDQANLVIIRHTPSLNAGADDKGA